MGQAATRKSLVAPFHQRVVLFSQGRKSAGPRYVENAKYSPRIRHMSSRNQLDQQKWRACSNQEYDVLAVSETVRSNRRGKSVIVKVRGQLTLAGALTRTNSLVRGFTWR